MNYLQISQKILIKYYKDINNNLKLILKNELLRSESDEKSKITNSVYGVVRKEKLLDFFISKLSKINIKKIEIETLLLLKTGLFLIFYSQSTPGYAIVNEIVKLSNKRSKNFVNAILRNSIRQKEELVSKVLDLNLETQYSVSKEIIENIKLLSNKPETFLKYLNKEPVFHLRENLTGTGIDEKKKNEEILKTLNFISPINTYEINKPDRIIDSNIKNGTLYIQNTGSQLISIISSYYAKNIVLDCCAAPGIKSVTLQNLSPDLRIVANDLSYNRINLLDKNKNKKIQLTVSDISNPAFKDNFDLLIVDAPCSSSGTLRKSPDLKTKIKQNLIEKNSKTQNQILNSIISKFSSTYILYSVCSFIKLETEDVIENLIKNNANKSLENIDISKILDKYNFLYKKKKYGYFLLPNDKLNNDLFYISLIKTP